MFLLITELVDSFGGVLSLELMLRLFASCLQMRQIQRPSAEWSSWCSREMDPRGRGLNPTSTSLTPSIWWWERCMFCEDNNSRVEVRGIVTSRGTTSRNWPAMTLSCPFEPHSTCLGCHAWDASPAMLAQQWPVQWNSSVQVSSREGRFQRPRALPPVRLGPLLGLLLAARPATVRQGTYK